MPNLIKHSQSSLIFACVLVIFLVLFRYIEVHVGIGGLAIVSIALFLLYIVILATYLLLFAWNLIQRRLKAALSLFGGIIILSMILIFGQVLNDSVFYSIDFLRFHANKAHYIAVVQNAPPDPDGMKVIFFDWGSGGYLATNFFYALAYDNSGQIIFPAEMRTKQWKQIVSAQYNIMNEERCNSKIRTLEDAFYLVETLCQ